MLKATPFDGIEDILDPLNYKTKKEMKTQVQERKEEVELPKSNCTEILKQET